MAQRKNSYKNLQKHIRQLKTPEIKTWRNQYFQKDYVVHIETDEFNCICPKTGLPDFATIYIDYIPDKDCVELKSFKEYLVSFRNVGIFHEHAINKIFDDFLASCHPRYAKIEGVFNIRGGIRTRVTREYKSRGTRRK